MNIVQHPPILPEGWRVEHSTQYNCPFYVNIHTSETSWAIPTAPALPAQALQLLPTQQNPPSTPPGPKDATQYPTGTTTIIANGQPTPVHSPVGPAKQTYSPPSQNTQQPNQAYNVHVLGPIPHSLLGLRNIYPQLSIRPSNNSLLRYQCHTLSQSIVKSLYPQF
jgi:hypothetical protein